MISKFNFYVQDLKLIEEYRNQINKYIKITNVSTNLKPENHSLIFCKNWRPIEEEVFANIGNSLIVVPVHANMKNNNIKKNNQILYVNNPRKNYAMILQYILKKNKEVRKYKEYKKNIVIGENVEIEKNTIIEPFVFIDHDVVIRDYCRIKSGVRISKYVQIGSNTTIRENSVLGGDGFGIEKNDDGSTIKIAHMGGLVIGNNVEIGPLNTIDSGTIEPTRINDYVKTSGNIHIAHNCKIGRGTLIAACAELSGSVIVGEGSKIGPSAVIKEKIRIGKNARVGLGAVVLKSFRDDMILVGNPAKSIDEYKLIKQAQQKLVKELFKKK